MSHAASIAPPWDRLCYYLAMAHIHDKPGQHDLTATAVIFRTDTPEPTVLLHVHRILKSYMPFGGHVELHENPWAALVHEIREESGYDISQLKLLQPPHARFSHLDDGRTSLHPLPFILMTFPFGDEDHFHTDMGYAFVADQPPKHKPADGESEQLELLTRHDIAALPDDKIVKNVREPILFAFEQILGHWEVVEPSLYHS